MGKLPAGGNVLQGLQEGWQPLGSKLGPNPLTPSLTRSKVAGGKKRQGEATCTKTSSPGETFSSYFFMWLPNQVIF